MLNLNENRPDEAIQAWRAGLVMTGGTDDRLTAGLAELLIENGRLTEAKPLVEQFRRLTGGEVANPRDQITHDSNDAKYHYLNGLALLKDNHPHEAIAEFRSIRFKNLKEEATHRDLGGASTWRLGQAYETDQDPGKAEDAYKRAAELTSDSPTPWVALARLQGATNPEQAEATLNRGLAVLP